MSAGGPVLAYREYGAAPTRVVVLLHGLSGISDSYEPIAAAIADRFHVYAIDFRGHGDSDRVPCSYVLHNYAADIASFIESIRRPVVLAGHSLGGAVAAFLAGTRPDLISAALLEDPPLYHGDPAFFATTPFAAMFRARRDDMQRLRGASRAEVASFLAAQPTATGRAAVDELTDEAVAARIEAFMKTDPTVFDPAIEGRAVGGWDPDTPIAVAPLTVLRADPTLGAAFLPTDVERFRSAAPHARIVEMTGAPHGIHTFRAAVERYLSELEAVLAGVS